MAGSHWVRLDGNGRAEGNGLPAGPFYGIEADPPWRFVSWDKRALVPTLGEQPYPTMTLEDLKALPVAQLAAPACVLLLWTTSDHLANALELGRAWGFTYKALGFNWTKLDSKGKPRMGMGYWIRQESEISLLFTRGKPRRLSAGVRQAILEPRREHSRKPDASHDRFRDLVRGPHLELFGRRPRFGWTVWGNEVSNGGDNVLPATATA